jgi:DnaJ family protein A protein 2
MPGQGNEAPGFRAGDAVFVVVEQKHPLFKRKNNDLLMTMTLNLSEALTGFTRVIQHLDGRKLVLRSRPGEVITHNSVRIIKGEGMPKVSNFKSKGRLFVRFRVEFPDANTLPESVLTVCNAALPEPQLEADTRNTEAAEKMYPCDDMFGYCGSAYRDEEDYFGCLMA